MDALISVKKGMSLAIISDNDYPIVEVTTEAAVIAATSERSASNIARRTGGEVLNTPHKEFPFEIHLKLTLFDRVIEVERWTEIISKYSND